MMKVKIFTVTLIVFDSFWRGLPNIAFFYSTLTSLSLLFCLFLYICNVIQLEFSPQNGGRATEVPPSGCYPKSIRVSPLGLLYSLLQPARAHQMPECKSLRSQVDSFTLTENRRAPYRSDITCVRSKMIFSPEFNVAISVGIHRQKHKLVHIPTNVNQYLHRITV